MSRIHIIPEHEDFVGRIAERFFTGTGTDLSRTAVIFPGKRPFLYLNRLLAQRMGGPFFPPQEWTMKDLLDRISVGQEEKTVWEDCDPLDAIYLLCHLIREEESFRDVPHMGTLERLFPWAERICKFIDQMDREDVDPGKLRNLGENAKIGFEDVPREVNRIFIGIENLRTRFHAELEKRGKWTGGMRYLKALQNIGKIDLEKWGIDRVLFAGLFALTEVEKRIVQALWQSGKAEIVWNAFPADYPKVLNNLYAFFKPGQEPEVLGKHGPEKDPEFTFTSVPDIHAEALVVRDLLIGKRIERTAVVCPKPENLFPVLTFAVEDLKDHGNLDNFNISLRYPLERTTLFGLVKTLVDVQMRTQESESGIQYRTKDYLRILFHPFVKNMEVGEISGRNAASAAARVLRGDFSPEGEIGSPLARAATVRLMEIEQDQLILKFAAQSDARTRAGLAEFLGSFHNLFLRAFERVKTLGELCEAVSAALDFIISHSSIRSFILSGEVFKSLRTILDDLSKTDFASEPVSRTLLFSIFQQRLSSSDIPFNTQPLQDLEVIGMLETRGLVFDELVILDMQEGVLPSEQKIDPLIPLSAYAILGLPDNESFQEMEAYYFNRLVHSSKKVHLVWIQDAEHRRSRFVERLIWKQEKKEGQVGCVDVRGFSLPLQLVSRQNSDFHVRKDKAVMDVLEKMVFSPTSIDTYLFCRLKFYYEKILGLRAPGKVAEGLEADEQGRIIHSILERAFGPFVGIRFAREHQEELGQSVKDAISFYLPENRISGEQFLFKRIVSHRLGEYVDSLFMGTPDLTVLELEKDHSATLDLNGKQIQIHGRVDRLDSQSGTTLLVDYKTGGSSFVRMRPEWPTSFPDVESVRKQVSSFQLPLYMTMLLKEREGLDPERLDAKLVFLREKNGGRVKEINLSTPLVRKKNPLPLNMKGFLENYYHVALDRLMTEMLDSSVPFSPYADQECKFCPFRDFCGQE